MKCFRTSSVLLLGIAVVIFGATVSAASLRVDFNLATSPTQSGWEPFAGNGEYASSVLPVTVSFPEDQLAGVGNSVDVSLDTTASIMYFRNYQAVTGSNINDVLRDDALLNTPAVLSLGLDNLLSGEYEITTYHHSSLGSQYRNTHFDLSVSDFLGTDRSIDSNVPVTYGTNVSTYTSRTFRFWVDPDAMTVEIKFDCPDADGPNHFALSGFQLTRVPEPAAVTLMVFGVALFLPFVRRRRKG